jgi:hypothetical protein
MISNVFDQSPADELFAASPAQCLSAKEVSRTSTTQAASTLSTSAMTSILPARVEPTSENTSFILYRRRPSRPSGLL